MGRTGPIRFEVWVTVPRPDRAVDRTRVATAVTPTAAFTRVVEVIQQWAASEGAITPGTEVSIKDTADGGDLFSAQYLGFETNLLNGKEFQWPGVPSKKSPRVTRWPR